MNDDESFVIAIEQYLYWHDLGLTHRQMLDALDYAVIPDRIPARDVVEKIALSWRLLRRDAAA